MDGWHRWALCYVLVEDVCVECGGWGSLLNKVGRFGEGSEG